MKAVLHADGKPRCRWATADPLYVRYHDEEWGVPVNDHVAGCFRAAGP